MSVASLAACLPSLLCKLDVLVQIIAATGSVNARLYGWQILHAKHPRVFAFFVRNAGKNASLASKRKLVSKPQGLRRETAANQRTHYYCIVSLRGCQVICIVFFLHAQKTAVWCKRTRGAGNSQVKRLKLADEFDSFKANAVCYALSRALSFDHCEQAQSTITNAQ